MEYYELFAAFRLSLMLTRTGMGMKQSGILPPESDFDTNNFAAQLLGKMLAEVD